MSNPINDFLNELRDSVIATAIVSEKQHITIEALTRRIAQLEYAYQKLHESVVPPPVVAIAHDPQFFAAVGMAAKHKRHLEHLQKVCKDFIAVQPPCHDCSTFREYKVFRAQVEHLARLLNEDRKSTNG